MKIEDAWNNFIKTGSVEKYLEYKNLCKEQEKNVNVDRGPSNEINKHR